MAAFLIVQRGEDIGRRFDLETTQLTVGRGSDNDMVLNDPMVSRYHAVVKRQGSGYLVIDLGSSNPVVINDQVCEPGEPRVLQHRDVVFIGKTVFSFQNRTSGSAPSPSVGRSQNAGGATQFVSPREEFDSPTPPPPSRNTPPPARNTPPPAASAMQEDRPITPPRVPEPPSAPSLPSSPPPPPPAEGDMMNDDRTMISGIGRVAEQTPPSFAPLPPPPGGPRPQDDSGTRTTPGISVGFGAPPPPPPPSFAPPKPPAGGPMDDEEGDMQTQIVPRR